MTEFAIIICKHTFFNVAKRCRAGMQIDWCGSKLVPFVTGCIELLKLYFAIFSVSALPLHKDVALSGPEGTLH
jgi:hypothetical protein